MRRLLLLAAVLLVVAGLVAVWTYDDGAGIDVRPPDVEVDTPALRAQWEAELGTMRERIRRMRRALVDQLAKAGVKGDLEYIVRQNGMFSYSGLSASQMQRLRTEFGVYGVDSGRICVAALNDGNLAYVAESIAAVSA